MSLRDDIANRLIADTRLAILAELAQQRDASLNSLTLGMLVDTLGVRRSAEWLDNQLVWLADMGAVQLTEANLPGLGLVKVATLTSVGRNHVERRSAITGVSAPADVR